MRGKTLIIHIGAHKTGSTTIQEAFAAGKVSLRDRKILYTARLDHNYLRADFQSHVSGAPLPKRGPRQLSFAQLAEAIRKTDANYILISAEYFEKLDPDVMREVVDTYFRPHVERVRIIAYLRPHVARLLSGYGEAIKIGWFSGSMAEYFATEQKELTYAVRFGQWKEAFAEELTVRPMHPQLLKHGSVLNDFVEIAFDGTETEALPDQVSNPSLTVQDLAFIRFIQQRFHDRVDWFRHTFGWELARQLNKSVPSGPTAEKLMMDAELARTVQAVCEPDAAQVDEMFFEGKQVMSAALADACSHTVPEPQSLDATAYFSVEEIRNLTALRELIWDAMRAKHDWPTFFHGFRIGQVEGPDKVDIVS